MCSKAPDSPSLGVLPPQRSFDKNASPFYPAASQPTAYNPAYGANNRPQGNFYGGAHFVRIDNLPESVSKLQLVDLISLIIHTNIPGRLPTHRYNLIGFRQNGLSHIEVYNYAFAARLVDLLNGYEWLERLLEARLLDAPDAALEGPELGDSDSTASSTPSLANQVPYYALFYGSQFGYDYYASTPQGLVSSIPPLPPPPMPLAQPNMAPPYYAPSQYGFQGPRVSLSRRSSSKSVESRKTLRNNSFSRLNYKPVAPFLMNLVAPKDHQADEEALDVEADLSDFIVVKNDEGLPVKVNPCRIFVGNIPFNSTWASLKTFLLRRSHEIDPEHPIDLLRVEIPMNNSPTATASPAVNYQYTVGFDHKQEKQRTYSGVDEHHHQPRGGSRGFAIVTTRDRASLERIIEYFDNVDFEGRKLTVRYDKFPEFNNYVLQQLHPNGGNGGSISSGSIKSTCSSSTNKSSVISNLAFERNSFQQQFYYGIGIPGADSGAPYAQMYYHNMLHYPANYPAQQFPPYYGLMGPRPGIYPPSGVPMTSMAEMGYSPNFGDAFLPTNDNLEGVEYESEDERVKETHGSETGQDEDVERAAHGPFQAKQTPEVENRGAYKTENSSVTANRGLAYVKNGPVETRSPFQEEVPVLFPPPVRQRKSSEDRSNDRELSDDQKARDLVNSFSSMGI